VIARAGHGAMMFIAVARRQSPVSPGMTPDAPGYGLSVCLDHGGSPGFIDFGDPPLPFHPVVTGRIVQPPDDLVFVQWRPFGLDQTCQSHGGTEQPGVPTASLPPCEVVQVGG